MGPEWNSVVIERHPADLGRSADLSLAQPTACEWLERWLRRHSILVTRSLGDLQTSDGAASS